MKIENRDEARKIIKNRGFTVGNITMDFKRILHMTISRSLRSSDACNGTLSMNKMCNNGNLRCKSDYFSSREAVSFNVDGFIGIAGWADDKNVAPILDGIGEWLELVGNNNAIRCAACKGPFHESTGHMFSPSMVLCGPCALSFKDWMKGRMGMMNAKLRNKETGNKFKESFGDAAARSVVAD